MGVQRTPSVIDTVTTTTGEGETSLHVVPGHVDIEVVHIDIDVSAAQDFMVVDLSDTANWPHTATGHIDIAYWIFNVNPTTTFAGDIELGFLTNVDATNGDFSPVFEIHMDKKQDSITSPINFGAFEMSLEAAHWFGPITTNDTAFQTDVALTGPDGNTFNSGSGDLVLRLEVGASSVAVGVTIGYRTHA